MNRLSDTKVLNRRRRLENLRKEEKRSQWWGYNERSRTGWYPVPPKKRMIEGTSTFFVHNN